MAIKRMKTFLRVYDGLKQESGQANYALGEASVAAKSDPNSQGAFEFNKLLESDAQGVVHSQWQAVTEQVTRGWLKASKAGYGSCRVRAVVGWRAGFDPAYPDLAVDDGVMPPNVVDAVYLYPKGAVVAYPGEQGLAG